MKTAARLAAVLALGVGASGCLAVDMLVKVKGDGSGTVEKSLTMNPEAMQQMAAEMKASGGDASVKTKDPSTITDKELLDGPFDPEELKKEAAKMGPGVTFVSATPVREKTRMGVKAVFAFKDVNQLVLNQKPLPEGGPGAKSSPEDEVRFALTKKGGNSVLTLKSKPFDLKSGAPKPKPSGSPAPAGMEKMAEGMFEMMKPMLKGLRITVGVEVDGALVKTNSPYVEGNRVTFLDMDFGALLADEKALKAFGEDMEGSLSQQKAALAKVKGMKVHLEPEMVVEFKAN
ncbi:MAG: hypothetical protein ABW221_07935 [Vicinamibacteria bacterium]